MDVRRGDSLVVGAWCMESTCFPSLGAFPYVQVDLWVMLGGSGNGIDITSCESDHGVAGHIWIYLNIFEHLFDHIFSKSIWHSI